ncbi:hypothetical protein MMC21_000206 [Puttea exsequens]|nr:hypothetical protein [Puttea exsequens]
MSQRGSINQDSQEESLPEDLNAITRLLRPLTAKQTYLERDTAALKTESWYLLSDENNPKRFEAGKTLQFLITKDRDIIEFLFRWLCNPPTGKKPGKEPTKKPGKELYDAEPDISFLGWTLRWAHAGFIDSADLETTLLVCIKKKTVRVRVLPPRDATEGANVFNAKQPQLFNLFVELWADAWNERTWENLGDLSHFKDQVLKLQ